MSHERRGESDEWYTPRYVFDALGVRFDLDVACPPEGPRHVPARNFYSAGALDLPWSGLVWMNPPFGSHATKRAWLEKFFAHGNGIALLPDRTSAAWWQESAPRAAAVLFVTPKIQFERPDGSRGDSPSVGTTLFAAGGVARDALCRAVSLGAVFTPHAIKDRRTAA
jgi:hypothetical protein